jgi:hypothetical protein
LLPSAIRKLKERMLLMLLFFQTREDEICLERSEGPLCLNVQAFI